ncbi:hypothetical protein ABRG53_2448 [Pseudanabaena sp. ABRG5-3]|nr:hypothetical protein ABRG53_2448 [Pseudanabaena sp. ABRG5-3]
MIVIDQVKINRLQVYLKNLTNSTFILDTEIQLLDIKLLETNGKS